MGKQQPAFMELEPSSHFKTSDFSCKICRHLCSKYIWVNSDLLLWNHFRWWLFHVAAESVPHLALIATGTQLFIAKSRPLSPLFGKIYCVLLFHFSLSLPVVGFLFCWLFFSLGECYTRMVLDSINPIITYSVDICFSALGQHKPISFAGLCFFIS